jgi:hypothetical protein
MTRIVQLAVRVPEEVRDQELKALKAAVDPLVPAYLKKPSQDDLVGILICNARAAAVAQSVERYYTMKNRLLPGGGLGPDA